MKYLKKNVLFIYIILAASILSCTSMSSKDWQNLQNKNFYFHSFLIYSKEINNKLAFNQMKSFPVEKILAILAHKYNISIDSSDFADFISSDTPEFKDDSILGVSVLRTDYKWENINNNPNTIELAYYSLPEPTGLNPNVVSLRYKITINIDGREKEVIYKELFSDQPVIFYIAKGLDYSRLNPGSDDVYINNETKQQIDLTKSNIFLAIYKKVDTNKEQTLSEETIKQDIKAYGSKLTPENKKIFRDNIIKFLYAELDSGKTGKQAKNTVKSTTENKQPVTEVTIKQDITKLTDKMTPEYKKLFKESIIKFMYTGIE